MTVRLLVDWKNPEDSKQYLVNNLLTTDAGTETGLVNAKLASSNLTGGTAWIAPLAVESTDETHPASVNIYSKIRAAIAEAYGRNYVEQAPWFNPLLWVTGATYYGGHFVRTSTGRVYYMNPSVASAVAGATEPSHVSNALVYDGGGSSGCPWHYFGMANAVKSGEVKSTVVPAAATDAMNGFYCTYAGTSTLSTLGLTKAVSLSHGSAGFDLLGGKPYLFSATNCTITSNVLTVAGTVTGTIKVPAHQAWVGSISAYVQILSQLSGTPGGVGTYAVAAIADKLTPFTITNHSYPRADIHGRNVGTLAAPVPGDTFVSARFTTNARWLAIERQAALSALTPFSVAVNGRAVSISNMSLPSVAGDKVILLNLAAVAENDIFDVEIFFKQPLVESMLSMYVGPDDFIAPHKNNGLTLTTEGDSTVAGGNGMPYSPTYDQATMLARMLGFDNYYQSAVGAAQLGVSGSYTSFIERLPDVILHAPQVHVVGGFHNDIVSSSTVFKGYLRTYIDTFRAALPDSFLVFTGCRRLRDASAGTWTTYEGYIRDVVAEYASTGKVFFQPILTDAVAWYPGPTAPAGRYWQPSGDAHPLLPEALIVTARLAGKIRDIFANAS